MHRGYVGMAKPWQRQPTGPASPAAPQNLLPSAQAPASCALGCRECAEHDAVVGQEQHFHQLVLSSLGGSQQLPQVPTFPPIPQPQPAVKPLVGDVLALLRSQELHIQRIGGCGNTAHGPDSAPVPRAACDRSRIYISWLPARRLGWENHLVFPLRFSEGELPPSHPS